MSGESYPVLDIEGVPLISGLMARNQIRCIYYDTYEVKLTQGKVALVSGRDLELVCRYRWYAVDLGATTARFYATMCWRKNGQKTKTVCMHRLIHPQWAVIDHADMNGLNNTRSNVREASSAKNNQNKNKARGKFSSKFKGVCWDRARRKWHASIKADGKRINLGCFESEIDAAIAYDRAAKQLFGEFARLNTSSVNSALQAPAPLSSRRAWKKKKVEAARSDATVAVWPKWFY